MERPYVTHDELVRRFGETIREVSGKDVIDDRQLLNDVLEGDNALLMTLVATYEMAVGQICSRGEFQSLMKRTVGSLRNIFVGAYVQATEK